MRVLPHSVPLSDRNLVAGLQLNDPQALEQAYGRYSARLLGFLLRLSPNRDVAEDLFQDAWCRLASSATGLHPETDLFAWLLIVARNRYYDWVRRASRQKSLPLSDVSGLQVIASGNYAPDAQSVAREQMLLLEQALRSLADLDREVLLLVGVEDLSHSRAAKVLGIAEVAFRKRLSRARERLEMALEQQTMDQQPKRRSKP